MDIKQLEDLEWPLTHYIFVEKIGKFQDTAMACWKELHEVLPRLDLQPSGFLALYKPNENLYRAGVSVVAPPQSLPSDLRYEEFAGGKYACFELKGSYSQLPEACGVAFHKVADEKRRNDFYLEHYLNDPRSTPEADLVTHILIPIH